MDDKMEKKEFYGEIFQQKSKNLRGTPRAASISDREVSDLYKTYENAISNIALPEPEFSSEIKFWEVIKNRHTTRSFSNKPISLMELSLLLFGTSGLTRVFPKFAFRTTPSAGALYPIETYFINNKVDQIDQGIYH
jgi:hypothetical protein